MIRKRLLFSVTLITLAGSVLRLHQLNSLPTGLHYDVAANAILVEEIAFNGQRPLFIEAYTGKEVLFFYSAALLFKLIGSSIFALRLAAAYWGLLAIPATYFAVRQVFRHEEKANWLATFCCLLLAFSFMHVVWSRFGMRAITQPVVQALALGFLYRGLRRKQFSNLALAGIFTGLSAYTYLAARAFPIPIAISIATFIIAQFRKPPTITSSVGRSPFPFSGLILFIAITLLVSGPLVLFFLEHPQAFFTRMSQIAIREGEGALLWRGFSGALGMLFISGEPYDRFNIPGKPIFDPVVGTLFILGLSVTVRRLIRARQSATSIAPVTYAAEMLLIAWLPIFLLPTALAVHDVFPSNVRAFGLLPLVFVYPARGLLVVSAWARGIPKEKHTLRIIYSLLHNPMILVTILAILTLVHTVHSYFYQWAKQETQHIVNDGDIKHAAQYLNSLDLRDVRVYMSAIHYRHPTMAYLAKDYDSIRWLTGAASLALPSTGETVYMFPQSAPPPSEWLLGWEQAFLDAPTDPNGNVDFQAYKFKSGVNTSLLDFKSSHATFRNLVHLTGYRVVEARAGNLVTVDLRLQVLNPPDLGDYRIVADLVDSWGIHWAQGFNDAYPSEQWQVDETIISRLVIPVPVGMPPGQYTLSVTVYSPSEDRNLPATNSDGTTMATASLGPIPVSRALNSYPLPKPQNASNAQIGRLHLLGYDIPETSMRPGEQLMLALYWTAEEAPKEDYQIGISLGDVIIESGAPVHNTYSTTNWENGEVVIDWHSIRLPRDLSAREHPLILTISDNVRRSKPIMLGNISVTAIDRVLRAPSPSQRTEVTIGDWVQLFGYDLESQNPLQLRLYWQTISETNTDYTVFIHVRDSDNQIVAQHDSVPVSGSYPTSLWISGEVIADTYSFDLPSGHYSLAVGMYLPETGERLKLPNNQDELLIQDLVIP